MVLESAEVRLVKSKMSNLTGGQHRRKQRIKFEDTNLAYADFALDPKLPA
jgi:hypothetical protein